MAGGAATAYLDSDGTLARIVPIVPGVYEEPAPTLLISGGGGSGAAATTELDLTISHVHRLHVTLSGHGYATAPVPVFIYLDGSTPVGLAATTTLLTTNGEVVAVNVSSSGTAYTPEDLAVAFDNTGTGGSGAAAIPTMKTKGKVARILVVVPGLFKTLPAIQIDGGGGSGAAATGTLATIGQVVELTNFIPGSYTVAPNVAFGGTSIESATALYHLGTLEWPTIPGFKTDPTYGIVINHFKKVIATGTPYPGRRRYLLNLAGAVLDYVSNGDANGAFTYFGKLGNGGVWRNPHTFGDIVVAADALVTGTVELLVDHATSNVIQDAVTGRAYFFDLLNRSLLCNKVSFRQRNATSVACLVQLQGTNDPNFISTDWHPLVNFTTPTTADTWVTTSVTPTIPYRRFRVISATANFAAGEVELYGTVPALVLEDFTGPFIDQEPYDQWKTLQIASKIDLTTLPPPTRFPVWHPLHLPPRLISIRALWSDRRSKEVAALKNVARGDVSSGLTGDILVKATEGYHGQVLGFGLRQWFLGPPPISAVPQKVDIIGSSGSVILTETSSRTFYDRHDDGGVRFGDSFNHIVRAVDIRDHIIIPGGFDIITPSETSPPQTAAAVSGGGSYVVVVAAGTLSFLTLDLHPSQPAYDIRGYTLLVDVQPEQWRFNLWQMTFIYVQIPYNS